MKWSDRRTDPDAEYIPERTRLEALGIGLMSLEDERWWTARARDLLNRDGAPLPPCRLDPLGRDCVQRDHGQCPGACRVALGRHNCDMLGSALDYLEGHGGPFCFSTLIEPKWAKPQGQLATFDLPRARRTLAQRFSRLGASGYGGFGMFEFDYVPSAEGGGLWTPHLHLITAGLTKEQAKEALHSPRLYPGHKPSETKCIDLDQLPYVLGYSTKRYASDRFCGRQPLRRDRQLEYERFALQYRITEFCFLVRLRRYGRNLVSPNP